MSARFYALIILVFCLCGSVSGQVLKLEINITETGKITSYYDEYWVVQVEGNMLIHNPWNSSLDFLKWRYDLGTLTIIEDNNTDHLKPWELHIPYMAPGDTINIGYEIRGISAYDPMWQNNSVLASAMRHHRATLYTFMISNIRKSEIENETIDRGDVRSIAERRLITVTLDNPSDLRQNITQIKVIKTPEQDPNNEIESWIFPEGPESIVIQPRSIWTEDIVDYNSSEGEVYWLSTDVVTDTIPIVVGSHFIWRYTEEDLYNVENASVGEKEYLENITQYLEHLMYLKKTVSKTHLMPLDEITVSVKINNFAPISRYHNLSETLPSGFVVKDSGGANASTENSLFWRGRLNPDSTTLVRYRLQFVDNESLGLDYFEPAIVMYENETLYSERIPFIRQYIPDKKIFIQKKLRYSLNDEIVVQLQLQNLGEADIEDLYVKEFLGANDVFREISIQPVEKGRWHIPLLKREEVWEVTYVTNDNPAVNLLPEVYGVDRKIVLKTLIFENVIRNEWLSPAMHYIEILAPLFALGFIVFYFVYRHRTRSKSVRGFSALGKQIHKLKKETEPSPQTKIDVLKKDSKTGKEIPSVEGYGITGAGARGKVTPREQARENIDKLEKIDEESKD